MSMINNIIYQGSGTEKQIAYAQNIINQVIDKIRDKQLEAFSRVDDKNMPEIWRNIWIEVGKIAETSIVKNYQNMDAAKVIDSSKKHKGILSISALVEKEARARYISAPQSDKVIV